LLLGMQHIDNHAEASGTVPPTQDSLLQRQAASQQAMVSKMYQARQATLLANRHKLGLVELSDGTVALQQPERQLQGVHNWSDVNLTRAPAPTPAPLPSQGAPVTVEVTPAASSAQVMEAENSAATSSTTKKTRQEHGVAAQGVGGVERSQEGPVGDKGGDGGGGGEVGNQGMDLSSVMADDVTLK
jgi:hypothetical protein